MATSQFRQVIGLNRTIDATGLNVRVDMVNWLVAPVSFITPLPNFVSRVPSSSVVSWGVTPAELAALQAGTIVEVSDSFSLQLSTVSSPAVIEAAALARLAQNQAILNLQSAATLAHIIGASLGPDGATWTAGP